MISFTLSSEAIEPDRLRNTLENLEAGALVVFEGRVRRRNAGRKVIRLEYEAFAPLAGSEGRRILKEVCDRLPILGAVCVHRTGTLELGEPAVWVGVVSEHRGDGFEACRAIIDEVKKRVPIWKKETYAEGDSGWVKPEEDSGG